MNEYANTHVTDSATPASEDLPFFTPEEEKAIDDLAGQFDYPRAIKRVVGMKRFAEWVSVTTSDEVSPGDEEAAVNEPQGQTDHQSHSTSGTSRDKKGFTGPDTRTFSWRERSIRDKVVTDSLGRKIVQ